VGRGNRTAVGGCASSSLDLTNHDMSKIDQALTYSVACGVPWYLRRFDPRRSVEVNFTRRDAGKHAPLRYELEFLLREELREVESYYAVLLAIATGHVTAREISQASGIGDRGLHYYLQQLVELGYAGAIR